MDRVGRRFPDRPPIQIGGNVAHFDAGWNAAVAVLAACYDRLRTGRGQAIDVSVQESQLTLNRSRISRFSNDGVLLRREGNRYAPAGMLECQDGWVQLVGIGDKQLDVLAAGDDAGDFDDPRLATTAERSLHRDLVGPALAAWCRARAKADVVDTLSALGCPVGAYARPTDLLASTQLHHREFFSDVDDGRGRNLRIPGAPYRLSVTPAVSRPAPSLGSVRGFRPRTPIDSAELPPGRGLQGIRIIDFTWAAAGPYATLLLALLGAEVIKIESSRRPDPARRGFLADYGGINRSPNFNELNLNKQCCQIDLTTEVGRNLARRLIATADVVIDNFRPGVMARFGFDAETLRSAHPELIVVSSSANGSSGPDAMMAGLASVFGATGGLSEQTGYGDGPPTEIGESTDYRSANALAVAVIAAILHRAETGVGQHVDVASREVVIASCPDALLAHGLGSPWAPRIGNAHRELSPHGVFAARADDEWIAIAVETGEDWVALCEIIGRPDWAADLADVDLRRRREIEIDAAITAWTSGRSASESFDILRRAGVPAFPVMNFEMLAADPHLHHRGVFTDVDHPEIGATRVMRAPWIFSDLDCPITRHGPLMGQDTADVLHRVLGLSADEIADLEGVLQ